MIVKIKLYGRATHLTYNFPITAGCMLIFYKHYVQFRNLFLSGNKSTKSESETIVLMAKKWFERTEKNIFTYLAANCNLVQNTDFYVRNNNYDKTENTTTHLHCFAELASQLHRLPIWSSNSRPPAACLQHPVAALSKCLLI